MQFWVLATTTTTGTHNPQNTTGGFIVGGDTQIPMRYSTLDRLIFVGSFIWMTHWGVKVSEVVLKALF